MPKATIESKVKEIVVRIGKECESRAYRASNELTNATMYILRGQRGGRVYNIPGTGRVKYYRRGEKKGTASITYRKYTASSPGEAPANRTGIFRMSWKRRDYTERTTGENRIMHAVSESDYKAGKYVLGELLEGGTSRMAARPYQQATIDRATPAIKKIYREPYIR